MTDSRQKRVNSTGKDQPIPIISFRNGEITKRHPDIKFSVMSSRKNTSEKLILAESKDHDHDFTGKNEHVLQPNFPCRYYIAVRNKRTNNVTVHDAEMYKLSRRSKSARPIFETATVKPSFHEKLDLLTTEFGSSRKQRSMRSRQLNKIEGLSLQAAMEESVLQANKMAAQVQAAVSTNTNQTAEQIEDEILPPHDTEAKRADKVYKCEDIISSIEFEALRDAADTKRIMTASSEDLVNWRSENKYGLFVMNQIHMLPLDDQMKTNQAIKLAYFNILLVFYSMGVKQLRRKDTFSQEVPMCIQKKLLREYTVLSPMTGGKFTRSRPNRLKDKLLLRILILALMIDNYRLQLQELMLDLEMAQKKITKYLGAIGAHVRKTSEKVLGIQVNNLVATIPIPVTFLEAKSVQNPKRKN